MKKELGLITGNLVLIGKFFTGCAAKFMKHAICLLFISILCISSDVLSSEFNYNYLQIAYTRIPDPEANGVSVSCSFDISIASSVETERLS